MSKKFQFPLEALGRHKRHSLDMARKEFVTIQNKIIEKTESLKIMLAQKSELMTSESLVSGTAQDLALQPMLLEMQRKRIDKTGQEILSLEEELERHRRWLAEINKEIKALDKLKEKQRSRWQKEMQKREQKQNDSWVTIQWSRQDKPGGLE